MNKPLTKEERAECKRMLTLRQGGHAICDDSLNAAMTAEAYWREAVKNTACSAHELYGHGGEYEQSCPFCHSYKIHSSDCPWLLAQDEAVECAHEWRRRRDGRWCGKCEAVEFGVQ